MSRRVRQDDFRAARTGAAAALVAVLIVLLLMDALSSEYQVEPYALVSLLTTIASLLGLAVRDYRQRDDEDA